MASGARRFVLQQLDKAEQDAPELPTGTVTATSPLTVEFQGASLVSPYVRCWSLYTPAVNDVVMLARSGGVWVVLGTSV